MKIDLNADVGEGADTDAELMEHITSANVCCGFHAGDPGICWETLELAKSFEVTCGAHPSFADRENFGRLEHPLDRHGAMLIGLQQIGALAAIGAKMGVALRYVKPHGALYHMASHDAEITRGLYDAASVFNKLWLLGMPGTVAERTASADKKLFIREGFADRRYRPDGTLVPRTEPNAVLHDPKEVVEQVEWLIQEKAVRTICVHGDTPGAVEFVRKVRESLLAKGHVIRAFAE